MDRKRIAVLAPISENGEEGGAEKFYKALTGALCVEGSQAEQINVICDESTFEKVEEAYQRLRKLDLSANDGVISTKAPANVVKHPNHISYLQHTMRIFYDMFRLNNELERTAQRVKQLQQEAERVDTKSGAVYDSRSWRITPPLRKLWKPFDKKSGTASSKPLEGETNTARDYLAKIESEQFSTGFSTDTPLSTDEFCNRTRSEFVNSEMDKT